MTRAVTPASGLSSTALSMPRLSRLSIPQCVSGHVSLPTNDLAWGNWGDPRILSCRSPVFSLASVCFASGGASVDGEMSSDSHSFVGSPDSELAGTVMPGSGDPVRIGQVASSSSVDFGAELDVPGERDSVTACGCRWRSDPRREYRLGRDSRHSIPSFSLSRLDAVRYRSTARSADRAVLIELKRPLAVMPAIRAP